MSTTTHRHTGHTGHTRSSQDLQEDIRHTRAEMDETLDELGERLNPRHLLDDLLGLFGTSSSSPHSRQALDVCQQAGKTTAKLVREHPVPALLWGAGLAWWLLAEEDDSEDDVARGQDVVAWHDEYVWEPKTEQGWTERARQNLEELKVKLSDNTLSAQEKLKHAASKITSLSGHKQQDIHARWASLQEHSGSFVDARTGQPYSESYGREWENLAACDAISCSQVEQHDASASERASETVKKLQSILADSGGAAKQAVQRCADAIGEYGRSTGSTAKHFGSAVSETAKQWGRSTRDGASRAGRSTARGARSLSNKARHGASRAQEQLADSYHMARDSITEALDEYPLAVGAACFGLGLLGGLAFPRTRTEDHLMGETSDELYSQAKHAGEDLYRRGKEVTSATAQAAMQEAERQGLTPHQMGEQTREAVAQTRESLHQAAPHAESAASDVKERVESVARAAADTAREKVKEESHHKPR